MNNKHLACAFLGMVIAAMAYGTMMFNTKVEAADEEREVAQRAHDGAVQARDAQRQSLAFLKKKTKGLRDYLKAWEPHLRQVRDSQFGESLVNLHIKRGNMMTLSSRFNARAHDKGGTIPQRLVGNLVFEDDYGKSLNWLADLEGALPASRVSSCRITKGQSGNDVKMELSLDIPILTVAKK